MHPKLICQKVWEYRADVGIAHDGDADRVLLCDEKGTLIDGDDILAIAGFRHARRGNSRAKDSRQHRYEQRRFGRRNSSCGWPHRPHHRW